MLRPATPLTILLFAAFVLLLISVISTPVVKGIPLARYNGYTFGVFGYCNGDDCTGIQIGYSVDVLNGVTPASGEIDLSSGARHSLSSLLIVHPIAAFFTLVMTALAAAAHFHSPSHSPRYLLALLILALPTLLLTLLAFLVDVLLFIPHLTWGGWIVLASVILIVISGIMLCAMRRTLVSRKARKRRIAENAEMSGENFYSRQERENYKLASMPMTGNESKAPLVSGAIGTEAVMPNHAHYPASHVSEERPYPPGSSPVSPNNEVARNFSTPSRSNSRPRPEEVPPLPNNQYGQPPTNYSQPPMQDGRPMNYPPGGYGRGRGYGPPRGRGGPMPGGRGGYGPPRGAYRGQPGQYANGRGGFGPDMRGGYGPNGRGGPPMGLIAAGAGGAMAAEAIHRKPPPQYPPNQMGPMSGPAPTPALYASNAQYEPLSPSDYGTPKDRTSYTGGQSVLFANGQPSSIQRSYDEDGLPRAESPPLEITPIGHAVEMNATTGRPSGYESGIQRSELPAGDDTESSPANRVQSEYVPPRNNWTNGPSEATPRKSLEGARAPSVVSNSSKYYEDVDPRFAEPIPTIPSQHEQPLSPPSRPSPVPNTNLQVVDPSFSVLPHNHSMENIPSGARSPAISEQSAFTSISQRPINPNWRPGNGGEFNSFGPLPPASHLRQQQHSNQAQQAKHDLLLANNPDFELPGTGSSRLRAAPGGGAGINGGRSGAMRGSPMGMPPPRQPLPPSALSLGGDGRYPEPVIPSGVGGSSVREV